MIRRLIIQWMTSEDYIVPYTGVPDKVLEIGCGEGGNLLPFINRDCKVVGIDKSTYKIKYANYRCCHLNAEFIESNIYDYKPDQKYDLILIKDTLEHLYFKEYLLRCCLRMYLKDDSRVFIAFSPWSMPFGGHQQCCKSFLRYIPYLHLLPFYEALLRLLETPAKVDALIEIKETRLSVRKFKEIIKDFKIEKETFWLINPSYNARFGIKPIKFFNIRFFVTSYWCVISKK